ncbi:MAG: cyclic nucleotide-binding domain-containing protein, partial [Polyangiales bacterium]
RSAEPNMSSPKPSELLPFLESSPLFGQLERAELEELAQEVEVVPVRKDDLLFRKGETGDCMYMVLSGQLGVFDDDPGAPDRLLKVMGRGEHVGEIALLGDAHRTATVRAQADGEILRLSRAGFERLLSKHPRARTALTGAMQQRMARTAPPPPSDLLAFLSSVPLFSGLPQSVLAELEPELQWMTLAAGEYLFRQGDPADCLYLVVSGRLRILSEQEHGSETVIGEIGRGQCVGEYGLLTDEPRSATVRPLRDSELLRVSKAVVDRLLERHPRAMLGLLRAVVTQARSSGQSASDKAARAIAIVPCGSRVQLDGLCAQLARALEPMGKVAHVGSRTARAAVGEAVDGSSEPNSVALMRYANQLEASHRYVLYQCDPTLSPWTRRCVRQADRVLLVAHVGDDPRRTEIERELIDARMGAMAVRLDLALIHPAGTRQATGTQRWLSVRRVDSHHHLRDGSLPDIERMVRRLAGRSIGLALSGGAAHGFAHIGVIRALREHGIPIDQVAGTSMGSVIAAGFALGWNEQELCAGVRKVFVDAKPLSDLAVPVASFLQGRRFAQGIAQLFGDTLIEDLWLGFACVSGNLTRGEPEVHESGPLAQSVMASCSIPGLVPPVVHGTELLVDGGVANNLPDDVLRARGQGPVIAVDVGPSVDLSIDARYREYPAGWKVLAHNVNPFDKVSVPTLLHILARTAMLSSHSATQRARTAASLYLRPRVGQYPFLDFHPIEEIAEEGYLSTKDEIARWHESFSG